MPDPSSHPARHFRALAAFMLAVAALMPLLAAGTQLGAPSAATPPAAPPLIVAPEPVELSTVRVTRVLDPDTVLLEIDGRTLRYDLLGVSPVMPAEHREHHTAAAIDYLTRTLLGESVLIQHDPRGERTASNTRAAYIFRAPDMLMVNLELVRLGYTRHSDAFMTIHREPFSYWAAKAQELERGIWNPDPPAHRLALESESQPETAPAPSHTPQDTTTEPATPGNTVYITKYGRSYHREDCPHLTDTQRPATRDQVRDTHKPCKTCKPDQP